MADEHKHSLEATKSRLGLGYGDSALIGTTILECVAYELARRDERIAAIEARLTTGGR